MIRHYPLTHRLWTIIIRFLLVCQEMADVFVWEISSRIFDNTQENCEDSVKIPKLYIQWYADAWYAFCSSTFSVFSGKMSYNKCKILHRYQFILKCFFSSFFFVVWLRLYARLAIHLGIENEQAFNRLFPLFCLTINNEK